MKRIKTFKLFENLYKYTNNKTKNELISKIKMFIKFGADEYYRLFEDLLIQNKYCCDEEIKFLYFDFFVIDSGEHDYEDMDINILKLILRKFITSYEYEANYRFEYDFNDIENEKEFNEISDFVDYLNHISYKINFKFKNYKDYLLNKDMEKFDI